MVSKQDGIPRLPAVLAGLGLLAMTGLAGYANFAILDTLIDTHDAARTARQIQQSLPLFFQGVQALYIVAGLDVVVAWALYALFRPCGPNISLLGAGLCTVYAGLLAYATYHMQQAYDLYSAASDQARAFSHILAFYALWEAGLLLFGFHLLAVGWLVFTDKRLSGVVAAVLGTFLIITGLGYVVDGIAFLAYPAVSFAITNYTFIGEVVFMAWLLWTGTTGGRRKAR